MRRTCNLLAVGALALLAPAGAAAHEGDDQAPLATAAQQAVATGCPGDPIRADRVLRGSFEAASQGGFVLVGFDVPRGTTAVRVKYCFDQPEAPLNAAFRHTLDLGLYAPRRGGTGLWGEREFRGWGGSSHPDVTVSAQGFSSEAEYVARPEGHVPGRTTRGFRPGPIRAGRWAAELGLAAIVGRDLGDADGRAAWRLEVELARDPAFAGRAYRSARYDASPARHRPGWYRGDLHVHAEHSALGDATMTETFGYAFRSRGRGGAGLDFITLTDYVTDSAWGEVGRYQGRHRGNLIARSSEVITYRGHLANQVSGRYVDYRTGPVHELRPDGSLFRLRGPRSPRELFADVRAAGGFTQINHPTIFPPGENPLSRFACRGCAWEYTPAETDFSRVDAFEVSTGPQRFGSTANPFTATAIAFYDRVLASGAKAAAVGVSDSHNAGRTPGGLTQSPIGRATTVVYADELSEAGISCGVRAGHTYVKLSGSGGPDLRLEARARGVPGAAIIGDILRARRATFTATVLGGRGTTLQVRRNGEVVRSIAVGASRRRVTFTATRPGRYRLQLQRAAITEAVTSPLYLERARRARIISRDCAPAR